MSVVEALLSWKIVAGQCNAEGLVYASRHASLFLSLVIHSPV